MRKLVCLIQISAKISIFIVFFPVRMKIVMQKWSCHTSYFAARRPWTQCVCRQESVSPQARSPGSSLKWQNTGHHLVGQQAERKKNCLLKSTISSWIPYSCLYSLLTNHNGGISLEGIKWTLPFPILCFFLKSQVSVCIRLHRQTQRYTGTENAYLQSLLVRVMINDWLSCWNTDKDPYALGFLICLTI